jgi:carboxymethylenebutenolidase
MDIQLKAADGHTLSAYAAGPQDAAIGLVVIQEIFGVNAHMRRLCDHFATLGIATVCPALFDRAERGAELGYGPADREKGLALRAKCPEDGVIADITAAAAALPAGAKKAIIGYCWGGTIAWWGATRTTLFGAAIGYYGGGIAATRAETPNCPVQLHFGELDKSIPMADVAKIREAQPGAEIFVYDGAGHGFACEERLDVYSPKDTETAEARSLDFLKRHLKAG